MKKCIQCGNESMDSAKFCESCGAKFPEQESQVKSAEVNSFNISNEAPPLPEVTATASNTGSSQNEYVAPPPNNGMVWLIVSSIFGLLGCCCVGLGILQVPTIITSAISTSRYKNGDYEDAKRLAKISMILFFSILALSIIIVILIAVTQSVNEFDYSNFSDFAEEYY